MNDRAIWPSARRGQPIAIIGGPAYPGGMFGFFNVNKPAGPTSHDIVARIRCILAGPVKVGHAGTLDPFASGVLVVCVGAATRLAEYVQGQPKCYSVEVALGATSSTDDPEGRITETPQASPPDEAEVRRVLAGFVGLIDQVPPAHSAVHVEGRRAYSLARAGRDVRLPARQVRIHRIELLSYKYPHLRLEVLCGSGTYMRSLARDVGAALGAGGYCLHLTRTAIGPFVLSQALAVEKLDPRRDLLDPLTALQDMPRVTVGDLQASRLVRGNAVELAEAAAGGEVAVLDAQGRLLAIARTEKESHLLSPTKVFPAD